MRSLKNFEHKTIACYDRKLIESKRDNSKSVLEEAEKLGIISEVIHNVLKDIYVKKNGNDTRFDAYFKKIQDEGKAALAAKQQKQMVNQPASQFTLTDLDGIQAPLADYIGKVLCLISGLHSADRAKHHFQLCRK